MELLSSKEAAAVLMVNHKTLLNLERQGILHPSRDFRGWRWYDPHEIEKERQRRKILAK